MAFERELLATAAATLLLHQINTFLPLCCMTSGL